MRESKQYKDAIMRESKDIEAWRTLQGHSHAGVQDIEAWRTLQGHSHAGVQDIQAWRTLQGHSHAGVQDIQAWRTVQGHSHAGVQTKLRLRGLSRDRGARSCGSPSDITA